MVDATPVDAQAAGPAIGAILVAGQAVVLMAGPAVVLIVDVTLMAGPAAGLMAGPAAGPAVVLMAGPAVVLIVDVTPVAGQAAGLTTVPTWIGDAGGPTPQVPRHGVGWRGVEQVASSARNTRIAPSGPR